MRWTITYDPEAHAAYIQVGGDQRRVRRTQEIDGQTMIDLDEDGQVVGIELLSVEAPGFRYQSGERTVSPREEYL